MTDPYANDDYKWPSTLYEEIRDMGAASFLIYTFGYMLDVARKDSVEGIKFDEKGLVASTAKENKNPDSRTMGRSFTPAEIATIIKANIETLTSHFSWFETSKTIMEQNLGEQAIRAKSSSKSRPLTLLEYADKYQTREMVYAVAKDDVNKRITLVFRGTDNDLSAVTNWTTNFAFAQKKIDLYGDDLSSTDVFKENLPNLKIMWLHTGFYNYVFGKTKTPDDDEETRKYDQILGDIKPLLAKNKGYKLFVTGHSLGGALAGMASFYLACDKDIPKPVTCIAFAAPRIGDYRYLEAVQMLEKKKLLRYCRIVNAYDSIACAPSTVYPLTYYQHGGFQVKLYKGAETDPELTYPKQKDSWTNRLTRTLGNSHFSFFNLEYDHTDYRERAEEHVEWLKSKSLNTMYGDSEMLGFELD